MSNINVAKFGAVVAVLAASLLAFGGSALAATFDLGPTTLRVGSSGMYVKNLQMNLSACGQAASSDGSFGPMTRAAVVAFQTGKTTADGIVGPATKALLASCGGSSTGGSSTVSGCLPGYAFSSTTGASCSGGSSSNNGDLSGTDGTINDVNTLSQYSSEEVGEGEEEVKVAGFEVEASNDGDIAIKSVKVSFDPTGNAAADSDHLDDYLSKVSIWMGSEEVGSADVEDFTENSDDTYSRTITLSGAVVDADSSENFYIVVDAANSFDSGDIDSDHWSVVVESIRFEDGSGVVTTDTTTGDLGDTGSNIGTNGTAGDGVPLSFVTFADSADTELKISAHTDNPEEGIVVVSTTGSTDGVTLLKGELELEGESDVVIDEFPVTFAAGTSNFNTMVDSITLIIDGDEYTETVPSIAAGATASITFDDLDFTVSAGDTIDFEVVAEIADADDFTAGSTITASVTSTNRSFIDAENEEGEQLAAGEKSGTAGGEDQTFRTNGISVDLVSTSATKSASDTNDGDTATFVIKFKVTAVGDDVYVATTASTAGAMNNLFSVDYSGTATLTDVSGVLVNNTDTDVTSGLYLIEEGESETFTMTVLRTTSATDDLFRAALTSIKWDDEAGDTTPDNNYTTNLDDFKTDYVSLD